MANTGHFWRNVVLIAVAHVALITGLIRWSLAARTSNAESIVWLGTSENITTGESQNEPSPQSPRASLPEPETSKQSELEKEPPVATTKSEIELPSPPPTARPVPKPTATPAAKAKATPKAVPKATPNKPLRAKASSKAASASATKSNDKSAKKEKNAVATSRPTSQGANGKAGPTTKVGSVGSGSSASEFAWYGNMLHDRFYSAWIQPTSNVPAGARISTLVRVRIEKDGRVSKFEITKPSGNAVVNESVAAVAKQVNEVDSPPAALIKGDHYDVKINFELNTSEGPDAR